MIQHFVPLLVFLLMFIIGASLKREDILRLNKQRHNILIVTCAQLVLLPIIALALIVFGDLQVEIAIGLLLVAICPGGAISNVYSLLAKANVAYSVLLTFINSLLAVLLLPLFITYFFPLLFDSQANLQGLMQKQALQLIIFLLIPSILGFALSEYKAQFINKALPLLERGGGVGLTLLLVTILVQFKDRVLPQLTELFGLAICFTGITLLLALFTSKYLKLAFAEKMAVLIELPVRNLALTAMLAVSIFDKPDYLLFAAVFFVVQTPIMLMLVAWSRSQFSDKQVALPEV